MTLEEGFGRMEAISSLDGRTVKKDIALYGGIKKTNGGSGRPFITLEGSIYAGDVQSCPLEAPTGEIVVSGTLEDSVISAGARFITIL